MWQMAEKAHRWLTSSGLYKDLGHLISNSPLLQPNPIQNNAP